MNDFINNPSRESLIEQLKLVEIIEAYKANGFEIVIEGGKVFYKMSPGERYEIGNFENLTETTEYLFGTKVPEGVEYITLHGVTIMTYYGKAIACGYMETSQANEVVYAINEYIQEDITSFVVGSYDEITGEDLYDTASQTATLIEELFRQQGSATDYDNAIARLTNLTNLTDGTPGADEVIESYVNVMSSAAEKKIVQLWC